MKRTSLLRLGCFGFRIDACWTGLRAAEFATFSLTWTKRNRSSVSEFSTSALFVEREVAAGFLGQHRQHTRSRGARTAGRAQHLFFAEAEQSKAHFGLGLQGEGAGPNVGGGMGNPASLIGCFYFIAGTGLQLSVGRRLILSTTKNSMGRFAFSRRSPSDSRMASKTGWR